MLLLEISRVPSDVFEAFLPISRLAEVLGPISAFLTPVLP